MAEIMFGIVKCDTELICINLFNVRSFLRGIVFPYPYPYSVFLAWSIVVLSPLLDVLR